MESYIQSEDMPEVAKYIGMGFYKVKESGEFMAADPMAREFFGIPQDETDLSKYSIAALYIFPAERKLRLDKLKNPEGKPISSTLSLRVNGEYRLLFDQCWREDREGDEMCFSGLVANIEDRVIFPKMFEEFPMGVYELDDDNTIVHFNKQALKIFGYTEEDRENLLGKNIADFYVDLVELKKFSEKVSNKGYAQDILKFRNSENKIIELECFAAHINEFKKARWGMIYDVTKRERYYRGLDKMPTGYYYIEYDEKGGHKHQGHIVECNEQFARILGVDNKQKMIGRDVGKFYASEEEGEAFFKRLEEEDKKGLPLLNHPFRFKRADNRKIAHIAIDAHLVKENGKVIGREGTIRDITEQVKLEAKVKDAERRLSRMTADINNLIHTFLHPVLKFSGHAELFQQLGKVLYKSIRLKDSVKINIHKLGKELEKKLIDIQKELEYIADNSENAAVLAPKLVKVINIFDYNLDKAGRSRILKDKATRDAALWVLEELDQIGFFNKSSRKGKLNDVITAKFIEYLQNILFDYLIRTARILQNETHVMKREVETLRKYIAVGQKKIYDFRMCNLSKILEENIEIFKPILAQRDIEIEYNPPGHIDAMISAIDIDRVICNLLHNADKYSYLSLGKGRVVRIKIKDLYHENAVEFSISSYGIPIKKGEIDSGAIFNFGYRSQFAYKTNREGTGVGLADAKDVIEQHHGTITITSKPVRDDGPPPQYKVPYITTVTIRLPKTRKGENK